jgi:CheY-like chemotaxis protein
VTRVKGISADFLPHVFDRFRQQDASSTRAHGGLGLGLSIVKYVVEMHGGSVDVFSEGTERGSVFTIRLPLNDMGEQRRLSAIAENGNRLESEEQLVGISILVIDDDEHAREMISAVLSDAGATVTTVATVGDAIEKVREEDFNVLVSDIAMPDEDGYVFLRQARALGIRTPALALTAYGSDSDKARALSAGFQAHLSKPVEPHEIVSTLARLAGLTGVEIQRSTER